MKIKVKALANLRHYTGDKKEEQVITVTAGDLDGEPCTVLKILQLMEIPESEVWKVMTAANNRIVKKDFLLSDGDALTIYPISAGG